MVTESSVDLGTLGWVKDEIDETLRQARLALEAFVEQRADEAKLRLCGTYLHQVSGTLTMVELDALAELVGEAEASVQALLVGTEAPREEVLEPLARALLLLPDIVDRVQVRGLGDGQDLLRLANELRAGRGLAPLPAQTFFVVDYSVRPPDATARDDAGFVAAFRQQRRVFQAALLAWLKGLRAPDDMTMADLLQDWRLRVAFMPVAQCLWVGEAFLRHILGATAAGADDKKLVSRLDQLLKRFADGQDKGGVRTQCERLTRDMLFVLRGAADTDEVVAAVAAAFGLGRGEEEPSGPSIAALRSIASALSQEIAQGQALLSRCFDSSQSGTAADGELVDLLDKMAKTFLALNIEPLKELVGEAANVCRAVGEGRLAKSGAVAMALAQALLQIETAARDIPYGVAGWQAGVEDQRRTLVNLSVAPDTTGMEVSEAPLSVQDRRQLIGAVGAEILANLAQIEERFIAFAASPWDHGGLSGVAALAGQVEAALQVLEEGVAAGLAGILFQALQGFAEGRLRPEGAAAEALAAAVAGLEAHVNGLKRGRPLAPSEIDALGAGLRAALAAAPSSAEPAPAGSPAAAPEPCSSAHPPIDPEILPVFLEDAHQAIAQLDEALPAWQADGADETAIGLARRAFHTLKGSGRMVEAGEIAELCYDAETLLNKVRARELGTLPATVSWIGQAAQAVRDWVQAIESGRPLPEMMAIRQALQTLSAGGELSAAPPPEARRAPAIGEGEVLVLATPAPAAEVDAVVAPIPGAEDGARHDPDASLLAHDPLLRDIFVNETRDHLAVLRDVFATGAEAPVSAPLLRAVHTMQGSARSVSLVAMAEACAGIEHYLQRRELNQEPVGAEGVQLLTDLARETEGLLEALVSGVAGGDFSGLALRLAAIAHEDLPAPELTWWQKNSAMQESARIGTEAEASAAAEDPAAVPEERVPAAAVFVPHEEAQGPEIPAPAALGAGETPETIDPELRDIFQDEARDLLESFEAALADWRGQRENKEYLGSLKRVLHTLKGGARMCGAMRMGDLAHATEELLRRVEEGGAVDDSTFALMDAAAEGLGALYKAFVTGRSLALTPEHTRLLAALRGETRPGEGGAVPVGAPPRATDEPPRDEPGTAEVALKAAGDTAPAALPEPHEDLFQPEVATQVRVRTALLDRLVAYAGEVSIARSRMEQQVFSLKEHLVELNGNVKRFREQVRELEIQAESQIVARAQIDQGNVAQDFDPLEFDRYSRLQQLSRGLTENLHDLITLHGTLDGVASQAEAVLQQQARVNTELQEGLMRTRMVSFATQAHRLRQIVRQTSRELNKRAELILAAADVELDRHLLERMIGPFEHMIRNAIDHGLEPVAERERLGKPATGSITIQAAHESGEIVIRVSDDGAGLNIDRIRAKAIERRLVPTAALLSDEQVMQFILLPGFSTAAKVTHLSGRGVGMDVVHSEVKKLGGAITVDTKPGRGTTFVIRLPLTLSITQALMVSCGDQMFAVPLAAIVNIVEAPGGAIADALRQPKPILRYGGKDYPFMDLGARLGITRAGDVPRKLPVLLLRLDAREVAVAVDGLSGTREVVVKSLGPQLSEIRGLFGATILGDGRVLLILDIPALWAEDEGLRVVPMTPEAPAAARPHVLVVDDSLTVRKVTTRFLQKQGFDTAAAKDGIEALEHLRERIPDVMLVDIEMPRMDGYELTARVRDDVRLRHIPIIMITSRSGHKHRERALSLGVDTYLGKPYQEEDLRKEISALLRRGHA